MPIGRNVVQVIFRGVDQISRNTGGMLGILRTMGRTVLGVAAAFAILQGAVKFQQAVDSLTLMENRLRLVTSSSAELAAIQQRLIELAQETRIQYSSVVELYARVARSSTQLGISQQRVLDITKAVNQAIQISGATTKEAIASTIQFAQGLASSRLAGEELRSILEQLPRLSQALADGLGVTIGQLRALGQQGGLTARTVIEALESQADKINEEFQTIVPTIGQAFTKLGNAILIVVGKLDRALGISRAIATVIGAVADYITDIATTDQDELEAQLEGLTVRIDRLNEALANQAMSEAQRSATLGRIAILEGERAEVQALVDAYNALSVEITDGTGRALEEFDVTAFKAQAGIKRLSEVIIEFTGNVGELQEITVKRVGEALIVTSDQLEERMTTLQKQLEEISLQAARNMQDAFADFLFDPFDDGLKGMVKGFIDAIRRMIAEALSARLFNKLFGASDGSAGSDFDVGKIFGSIFKGGRATGGFTFPGGLHRINEQEPEFLISADRSQVVPLSKAAAAGINTGGGITYAPQTSVTLQSGSQRDREELEFYLAQRDQRVLAEFKRMVIDGDLS